MACLPIDKYWYSSALVFLGCFRVALRILIKLLLALDSTKVKCLSLIGCCCGCVLRIDFHSTDGVTHERWLTFHNLLLSVSVSGYCKRSALHVLLADSPVTESNVLAGLTTSYKLLGTINTYANCTVWRSSGQQNRKSVTSDRSSSISLGGSFLIWRNDVTVQSIYGHFFEDVDFVNHVILRLSQLDLDRMASRCALFCDGGRVRQSQMSMAEQLDFFILSCTPANPQADYGEQHLNSRVPLYLMYHRRNRLYRQSPAIKDHPSVVALSVHA